MVSPEDFSRSRRVVEEWALRHPIPDLSFQMDAIYPEMKLGAVRAGLDSLSIPQTVSTMSEQMEDVQYCLNLFNKHLPSRIRWRGSTHRGTLGGVDRSPWLVSNQSQIVCRHRSLSTELRTRGRGAFCDLPVNRRGTRNNLEVEKIAERREDFMRSAQSEIEPSQRRSGAAPGLYTRTGGNTEVSGRLVPQC
jgi:hypothetical protein